MKIPGKPAAKQVLGVMADGTELRIANLGIEKGEVAIYSLETISLPARLGKLRTATAAQPAAVDADETDIFGFEEGEGVEEADSKEGEQGEHEGADLSSTLINVFAKFPLKKTKLAVNIPEGQATYYSFESDFGLKAKKLQKRLREEIGPLAGGTLDSAIIDHFKTESKGLMVVVSEGNIPLIEELIDIKNFLAGGVPYFCQVSSNEISLVNLVRATMDPQPDQITAIVYIGNEFSRVIILKGDEPISFIQAIREGYNSPQVCQTLFSKILLEQEEAGIPEIDQIVLTGEIGITRAHQFFSKQFPDADVKPITPGPLDTSLLKNEEIAIFSNYAIPVAMAWEALQKRNPRWLKLDLMPHAVKEAQKPFKVAWHGFAMLGIIFFFMALLTYQGFNRLNSIRSLEESIALKQSSIASLEPELVKIGQLQRQININKGNLEFLDALIEDPEKWSRLFAKLSEDFQKVNRIWIDHIQSTPYGFTMVGKALARDRVPLLAAGFQGVNLKRVTRVISEQGNVIYEFEIDAEIPPPLEPEPAEHEPVSTDRIATPGGSIAANSKSPSGTGGSFAARLPEEKKVPPSVKTTPKESNKSLPETPEKNVDQKIGPMAKKVEKEEPIFAKMNKPESNAVGIEKQQPDLVDTKKRVPVTAQVKSEKPQIAEVKKTKNTTVEQKEKRASAEQAISISKKDQTPIDHYKQGLNLIHKRDIKGAMAEFQTLLNENPDIAKAAAAHYWVGECHYALKNYEEAAREFEVSLDYANNPKRQAGMMMLGMSYLKLGQKEKAGEQFEAILKAFPNGEFAKTAKRKLAELTG